MTTLTPAVRETAEAAVDWIVSGPSDGGPRLLSIDGPAGAGRTTSLAEAYQALPDDILGVLLAPPPHADAGSAAMLDSVLQLHGGGAVTDEQLRWWESGRRHWSERLDALKGWLDDAGDRLVLFCDEPARWAAAAADTPWRALGDAVASTLVLDAPYRVVVAGQPPSGRPARHSLPLMRPSGCAALLTAGERAWGELADVAAALATRPWAGALTPFEARLMVALASLDVTIPPWQVSAVDALSLLAERLGEGPGMARRAARCWARLALVRRPLPMSEAEELVGGARLNPPLPDIVWRCLCVAEAAGVRLHDIARQQAIAASRGALALDIDQRRQFELKLFTRHRDTFNAARDSGDPSAVLHAQEAHFYATSTLRPAERDGVQAYFAEHLVLLGERLLEQPAAQPRDAVEVFEQAQAFDRKESAAYHGLGRALDLQGAEAPRALEAHREAVALQRTEPRWHVGLIEHLLLRGRVTEADTAFEEALACLAGAGSDPSFADHLHVPAARLFLAAGELPSARRALQAARPAARTAALEALDARVAAAAEAADFAEVVPLRMLGTRWWTGGPTKLGWHRDSRRLIRWLPGRIVSVEDNNVGFQVARVTPRQQERPRLHRTTLPIGRAIELCEDDVSAEDLRPGALVEFGVYTGDGDDITVLRMIDDGA